MQKYPSFGVLREIMDILIDRTKNKVNTPNYHCRNKFPFLLTPLSAIIIAESGGDVRLKLTDALRPTHLCSFAEYRKKREVSR